jgi:hypothetical protein
MLCCGVCVCLSTSASHAAYVLNGEVKLREAKATTLRRVLLARSCAMGGEDVVGEVKGVDEVGMRFACRGRGVE